MAFYYLLLGHLIGDFVLQTDKIAENKGRRWSWNLLHVLVVTFCILIFSYSFGTPLIFLVLLNGAAHFVLDFHKKDIMGILHLSELQGFLFDQLLHILLLLFISQAADYETSQLLDYRTVMLLIVLVLVTSFSAVLTQFILSALFPRTGNAFFKEGEKQVGILTRLYVSVVFYLAFVISPLYLLLLAIAAVIFLLQFKLKWNKWMSHSHLLVKLLLDTAISAVCTLLVIF
jgi:cobalamin synthase